MRTFKLLALACVVGLGGCSNLPAPASVYQLSSAGFTAPNAQALTPVVAFSKLEIAPYLASTTLVQRLDDTTISLETPARWAVNLETAISQWLVRQLASTLKTQSVFAEPPEHTALDARIALQISRLDSGPAHAGVLDASWQVFNPNGTVAASRVLRLIEDHDGSLADQVRAQSVLLERLSAALGESVVQALRKPVVEKKPEPAAQPSAPIRPRAKPARSVEVFRF